MDILQSVRNGQLQKAFSVNETAFTSPIKLVEIVTFCDGKMNYAEIFPHLQIPILVIILFMMKSIQLN